LGFIDRIKAEVATISGALRALKMIGPIAKNPKRVFPLVFEELARKHGERIALVSEEESFTYRALDERANRYARWARANGIARGDTVALMMLNRPDYLAFWLGVIRAGGRVALINTNLTGSALAHCIRIVTPRHVVVGADLVPAIEAVRGEIGGDLPVWQHGAGEGERRIDRVVEGFSGAPLEASERVDLDIEDGALFIYTSGTTGLPKAANINHYRLMAMSHGFSGIMDVTPDDRMYDCLPMYHSNGGVLATCATLVGGGTVIIRRRFKAREFWADVARERASIVFYIGELCRYLVNTPETAAERAHEVRLFCGNGLRPDIWGEFKRRFGVPKIVEWYAATEGNVALFNWTGKEGAVGRIPFYMKHRFPVRIVRFDVEREEPVRGFDGLCIECEVGEVGEILGLIVNDPNKPANRFEGYADPEATSRKILTDVVKPGDRWFRTGDLMRRDDQGYFYFVDRIGDTYRWKGENVSTSEVSEKITAFPGVRDASVYGVEVPGHDGRAGMAALVVDEGVDVQSLCAHIKAELPDYARPVFLRLTREIEVTGTFKQSKIALKKEGFGSRIGRSLHDARGWRLRAGGCRAPSADL
jgi:fatty-acyl-CoA synthase